MNKKKSYWAFARPVFFSLVLMGAQGPAWAGDVLESARQLIESGKSSEAFGLLAAQETERAGEPAFDLLLGIAAVDSGQNTRGIFALERVLTHDPKNARARAEIARALLAAGDTTAAKAEFETVRSQEVPPEVRQTIDRYLDAVDRIDFATKTTIRGYLEATLGHDDNVNVGSSRSSIAVPAFGNLPFELSKESRANSDEFGTVGAGVNLRHPLTPALALTAGISGWQKMNFNKDQFNVASVDLNLGLSLTRDRHVFSLAAQYGDFWVDDSEFRSANGMTGQWQFNLDARNQFSAFLQYADVEYDKQSIRDADRWVGGVAYAHALKTREVLFASVYNVQEKEKARDRKFLGFDGWGVRAGAQTAEGKPWLFFGSVSREHRRYGGDDPTFLDTREDIQYDLSLGATYRMDRVWSLTPRYSYVKNDSSIELNEYTRQIYSVTLRRDF